MDILESVFLRKKIAFDALEPFGFQRKGADYLLMKPLPDSGLVMTVTITAEGKVSAVVTDPALHEPYTLHLADGAVGSFVGGVRSEYEKLLTEISKGCFEPDVFKSEQAKKLIAYVREAYGNELEFLWEKLPANAIWRRNDDRKWYGALMTVSRRKLGQESDELVDIIDLRERAEAIKSFVDGEKYFAGWHMNKKSWYTIVLDGSLPTCEICGRIDVSFALAAK